MALDTDLTIILSGPVAQRGPASKALAQNGFTVADGDPKHGHGMADTEEVVTDENGQNPTAVAKADRSVGWLTVHGDDVDLAQELVGGFGWRLRAHYQRPQVTSPLLEDVPGLVTEDRVAEMIAQALKGR